MVGVDVGTAYIVSSKKDTETNNIVFKIIRNCFIGLDSLTDDISWLKENTNSTIVEIDDKSFIVGDDALGFGSSNITTKRPMRNGIINPTEEDSLIIISKIIEMAIGRSTYPGEIACASIPATSIDSGIDSINHEKLIGKIFKDLGYTFIPINEGLAIIYATNPTMEGDEGETIPFSGIGISMGGGQVNVCYAFRGIKVDELTFSIARSGDWIDEKVAESFGRDAFGVLNVKPNQVSKFKEKFLDLTRDEVEYTDKELDALGFKTSSRRNKFRKLHTYLCNYYDNLINFILANFVSKFKSSNIESEFPVEIVISGGTSMPSGVVEKFQKILDERQDFPFEIKNVRRADEPLYATAFGALNKAISEENKRKNKK